MGRKKKETPPPQWPAKEVSRENAPMRSCNAIIPQEKIVYSCGCAVIRVDETRIKPKCIKHQVE